jgi:hypothetical protein
VASEAPSGAVPVDAVLDGLLVVEHLVLELHLEAVTLDTRSQYACALIVATLIHQLPVCG